MPQMTPGQTSALGDLGSRYDQTIGDLNLEVTQQTISQDFTVGAFGFEPSLRSSRRLKERFPN